MSTSGDSYFETLSLDASRRLGDLQQPDEMPIDGILSTRIRSRWQGGEDRVELYGYAGLDVGAEGVTPVSFHTRAGAAWDLTYDSPSNFDGILQTYDSGAWARLYDCYLDVHTVPEVPVIRIGRQTDIETPALAVYDGLRVATAERGEYGWTAGAYGGRSVHYYDSFDDGHAIYGGFVSAYPWAGGRARLDWMHADDSTVFGGVHDDLIGLEVWHRIQEDLRLGGSFSMLDGKDRDLRLDADWYLPEEEAQVRARYYELLQPQEFRATEFDPFSEVIGVWEPFRQLDLDLSKGFDERYSVQAGADLRRVSSSGDVGRFNRDYDRWFFGGALEQTESMPARVGVTADLWKGSGRDVWSWGIDLARDLSDATTASLGTYYSLWKTDFALGEEREDVRTWFARVDHDLSSALQVEGRYEFEDSSQFDFHILRLRLTWTF